MEAFKGPLKGHGLRLEGRVATYFGVESGPGVGECACGAKSPRLPTTAARQRWHQEHKAQVVAEDVADDV